MMTLTLAAKTIAVRQKEPEGWEAAPVTARQAEAFARLWDVQRPQVWRLTARLSGSADWADDLTQEVAVRALAAWPTFRGGARASTWLYRIAVNVTLRWRETRREQTAADDTVLIGVPDLRATPEQAALQSDASVRLQAALESLPETLRVPLVLHAWEGMKYREIAEVLEIAPGTVMSRLNAARKKLREQVEAGDADAV